MPTDRRPARVRVEGVGNSLTRWLAVLRAGLASGRATFLWMSDYAMPKPSVEKPPKKAVPEPHAPVVAAAPGLVKTHAAQQRLKLGPKLPASTTAAAGSGSSCRRFWRRPQLPLAAAASIAGLGPRSRLPAKSMRPPSASAAAGAASPSPLVWRSPHAHPSVWGLLRRRPAARGIGCTVQKEPGST